MLHSVAQRGDIGRIKDTLTSNGRFVVDRSLLCSLKMAYRINVTPGRDFEHLELHFPGAKANQAR